MNQELWYVQDGFWEGRGSRHQIANICWIVEKAREFQKYIHFCFTDSTNAFDCVDPCKLWNILQEVGIQSRLTCLLWNLYSGQEEAVIIRQGSTVWFQFGKGVCQGCILSPCIFSLYAEYIMPNDLLDEVQAGIKVVRRNINNLRYSEDTTLMEEREEEVKRLLKKVK